jgi:hypothetical protein
MTNMNKHYRCKKHTSQMANASVVMKYATKKIDVSIVISVIMCSISGRDDAVVTSVNLYRMSRGDVAVVIYFNHV